MSLPPTAPTRTAPAAAPVVCVGAAHWDLLGRAARPPGPGGDVPGRVLRRPGGVALNVALGLAALGVAVALVAAIGRDAEGERLAAAEAAGIDARRLLRHDHPTDAYLAIEGPDGALHAAVADCAGLEAAGAALLAPMTAADLAGGLVVDGNLPAAAIAALASRARGPLALVAASPAKAARLRPALGLPGATLYANLAEAAAILGASPGDAAAAARALAAAGVAAALVTDGPREAAWMRAGSVVLRPPPPAAPQSVTGAGDVLVAAHLHARAAGADDPVALEAALAAAAGHVTRDPP